AARAARQVIRTADAVADAAAEAAVAADDVVASPSVQTVVAAFTEKLVVVQAAEDRVGTAVAMQVVVPGSTVEPIVVEHDSTGRAARQIASQRVVTVAAVQAVVSPPAGQMVVVILAGQRVVAVAAIQ